jgi:hypothetical protein
MVPEVVYPRDGDAVTLHPCPSWCVQGQHFLDTDAKRRTFTMPDEDADPPKRRTFTMPGEDPDPPDGEQPTE